MKDYDRSQPLIVIHIPKAAGTSTREVFKRWFGRNLREHYFREWRERMPQRLNLAVLHSERRPLALYGHFNSRRGFGIQDYYPEATQFLTILRDPFEAAVSTYFYYRKIGSGWRDPSRIPRGDLRDFLLQTPPNMLNHFPRPVTADNYRDMIETSFIEVGVMEHLEESLRRIADKLRMPFDPAWLPHLNAAERNDATTDTLRAEYIQRHPLEFEVYRYALARYTSEPL